MKNEKNYGRLDFDEKTSQLTKKEVLFDDSKASTKDLSSNMLKSAFGSSFNTMFDESISDFPNTKPGDYHEFTGVMPTPF